MSEIALADVTVTLSPENIFVADFPLRFSFPILTFGTGALYYDTHGVPLPPIGQLGMEREIKFLDIEQPANGYVYGYDRTVRTANPVGPTGTIRIFQGNGGTITAGTFTGDAHVPTGNVAVSGATSGGTPAGTVAEVAHAHSLVVLANSVSGAQTITDGVNSANNALVSNTATGYTVPGGNTANKGGVESTTPANATFAGAALATHTHAAGAFTGDSYTPTGNITGTVTMTAGALAELGHVTVAATVLRLKITGQ